ncbi:MAG: hypothetical protein Q8K29_10610 [Polaromonas sp.]|nr:hypothetical protein [Polaromonas sp.]
MKLLSVLFFLSSLSNLALAEAWEELVTLPGLKITIDKDSVRKLDQVVYGWQRWTYEQDQVFQGVTYRTSQSLIYTDCSNNTRANAHVLLLNEAGATLYDRRMPAIVFAPLIPATHPATVHFVICSKAGK